MAQDSNPDAHASQQRENVAWEEDMMGEDEKNV